MRELAKSTLICVASLALPMVAMAHTGHGTHSVMDGIVHPFGADHLLAMVAVGVWSARVLPASRVWQGPATFMGAMVMGALIGASGMSIPYLEHAIALSVVLLGAMLIVTSAASPALWGLGLIATAASLHGMAHGAEAPASGFAGYAAGFSLTTALLHTSGVGLGLGVQRWLSTRSKTVMAGMGTALGFAGVYLLNQV